MTTDISQTGSAIWQLVDKWMVEHQGERFDLDTICRQLDIKDVLLAKEHLTEWIKTRDSQKKEE